MSAWTWKPHEHSKTFGFSSNRSGAHLSRSMMLTEITALLPKLQSLSLEESKSKILDENILGKPTFSSRQKTLRNLTDLYTLEGKYTLFRIMHQFAALTPESIPQLGLVFAFCRDDQLRSSFAVIEKLKLGETLPLSTMIDHFENAWPDRFSIAMKSSLSQNVNTTWTVSGHLAGRIKKTRTLPVPTLAGVTYAMLAGYLYGLRSFSLIDSVFAKLVSNNREEIFPLLQMASIRGWCRFRQAGGVIDLDFSPLLTPTEQGACHESA
jgi:hypothetical protein